MQKEVELQAMNDLYMIDQLLFIAGSQLWELHALANSHRDESVRRAAKAVAAIPTDSELNPSLLISYVKRCHNPWGNALTHWPCCQLLTVCLYLYGCWGLCESANLASAARKIRYSAQVRKSTYKYPTDILEEYAGCFSLVALVGSYCRSVGHHVPMFGVADRPPGVAVAPVSADQNGSCSVSRPTFSDSC